LAPDLDHWTVPSEPGRLEIAVDYAWLGFAHIWDGPDHLLFVAGLLLLAAFPRRIVWAVTGFTAAHSITLSLAALGVFRVPIAPTEALIALSIVFLAAEIARSDPDSFSHRFPVVLSFAFGLLHGFGFASALGEIGLPRSELTTGLLFFNVGVELGQLAFIAAAVTVIAAVRTVVSRSAWLKEMRLDAYRPGIVGAYCLGVPAAFWFIDRAVSALAA
jgi:hydrogenase/urease accessory protein HupE